jgi:prephenate dehydratase
MSTKYAYLGPVGTFTETALIALTAGEDIERTPAISVQAALRQVRSGEVNGALVPIENSVEGSVSGTVDELSHGELLQIVDEVAIPVEFSLLVRPGKKLSDIKKVATHPHAQAQCREWLAKNLPGIPVLPAMSTAAAAADLNSQANYDAAIASASAAPHYGLVSLADGIGDKDAAWTRFVLVKKPGHLNKATGHDKTTLALFIKADRPGALLEILTEFAKHSVNLTRLESRPTKKQLGDYFFSLDAEGHIDDEKVGNALKALHRTCSDVKFLGSYPRHEEHGVIVDATITPQVEVDPELWLANLRQRDI